MDDQYFTDSSPARGDETHPLEVSARGFTLSMRVSSRVFSASKLDTGTRQLLEVAPDLPPRGALLDLGCGWGPLATVMSLEAPRCEVWAVDVNSRAVDLTARNAAANGASGVRALKASDALAESVRSGTFFDVIWSNPPVHRFLADTHGGIGAPVARGGRVPGGPASSRGGLADRVA